MPGEQEIAINTLPFWSSLSISLDLRYDGTNLQRVQITRGSKIPVFDYKKGTANVTALEGALATARDTILVQPNQTRGGGLYRIFGVSLTKDGKIFERKNIRDAISDGLDHQWWMAASMQPGNGAFGPQTMSVEDFRSFDSWLASALLDIFALTIFIDGTKRTLEMGPCQIYPGVGGVKSNVDATNGDTFVSNYMPIEEGITWNPSGAVDSNLVVELEAAYQLTTPCWTTPYGTANGEPPSQENPEITDANKTPLGRVWTVRYIVNFHGREESPVSNVS